MGPLTESDEALVLRSRRGDRAAFEELVRRTSRAVFARIYLETGDVGWTEDLVQETFLTAWRSIKSLNNPQAFRPWLFSIAHTALLQTVRRESRQRHAGSDEQLAGMADENPGPAESAELRERREAVLATLRAMPTEYRLPLTMRYLGGADYQTIGRELALSNGSLRGLLNRGMAMLRAQLKETEDKKAEAL
jgi:RNA polymerase sigma-70 factor (ECF subfamily)